MTEGSLIAANDAVIGALSQEVVDAGLGFRYGTVEAAIIVAGEGYAFREGVSGRKCWEGKGSADEPEKGCEVHNRDGGRRGHLAVAVSGCDGLTVTFSAINAGMFGPL